MKHSLNPKPLFVERMETLLGKADFEKYWESVQISPTRSIRANTLKIPVNELKKRLESKGWVLKQPFKNHPEIIIVESELNPGELGRSLEHLLGYYYVQELSSMLPVLILNPKPDESVLDLCASPGSKTSQISAKMNNSGTVIANDVKLGRIKILASNLERCGATNVILTKNDGLALCKRLKKSGITFDKILVDAPCSGEGTIKSAPKTLKMWSINSVYTLSRIQKALLESAIEILKPKGEIVYSTCTHSPEENEEVIDFILKNHPEIEIEKISLPIKFSPGIKKWKDREYLEEVKYSCRIYPHKSGTEGFFITKLRKKK